MPVLTASQLEALREELVNSFDAYRTQVTDGLDQVSACLSRGEYHQATTIMSTVSAHQAQASINLRTVLVKNGMIAREKEE